MGSAARGAALVGIAVVLGIILLQVIDDGPSGGTGSVVTTDSTVAPTDSTAAPTDSTAAASDHPRDQVRVLVLNGSNQANVATLKRNVLLGLGYQVEAPGNTQLRQGSVVACKPGFEGDAAQLAKDAGPPDLEVIPFPDPAPTGRQGEDVGAGNVNCIVILGEA
jgi:hypothetical protein